MKILRIINNVAAITVTSIDQIHFYDTRFFCNKSAMYQQYLTFPLIAY